MKQVGLRLNLGLQLAFEIPSCKTPCQRVPQFSRDKRPKRYHYWEKEVRIAFGTPSLLYFLFSLQPPWRGVSTVVFWLFHSVVTTNTLCINVPLSLTMRGQVSFFRFKIYGPLGLITLPNRVLSKATSMKTYSSNGEQSVGNALQDWNLELLCDTIHMSLPGNLTTSEIFWLFEYPVVHT